jgi:hypothetical protein
VGRRNRSRLLLAGAVVAVSSGAQFLAPATYRALASAPEGLPGVLSFIATVGWPFATGEILARNTAGLLMPLPRAAPATVALVAMVRWLCIVWRAWGFDEAALIRRRRVPVWLVIGEFPLPSPRDRVIRSARQQVGQLWLDMLRERRGRRALASTALWQVAWPFIAGACLSEGQAVQQGIYATGVRDADEALYQVFLSSLAWGFVLSMLVAVPGAWVLALTAILWTRRTARERREEMVASGGEGIRMTRSAALRWKFLRRRHGRRRLRLVAGVEPALEWLDRLAEETPATASRCTGRSPADDKGVGMAWRRR